MDYIVSISENQNGSYYAECNTAYDEEGRIRLLHNEVGFSFKKEENQIRLIEGWHIGTESFSLEPGDEDYVEHYHPGLLNQINEQLKYDVR